MPSNLHSSSLSLSDENPALQSLLHRHGSNTATPCHHHQRPNNKKTKSGGQGGGLLRTLKLLPLLSTGCNMVALLRNNRRLMTEKATIVRLRLAIQEDPHRAPVFVTELPMESHAFRKEVASSSSDVVRIALVESQTSGGDVNIKKKMKLFEECEWAVYCNGRKNMSDDGLHVMQLLSGVDIYEGKVQESGGIKRLGIFTRDQPKN